MTVLKVGLSDRRIGLDETVALFRDVISVPVTRETDDLVKFRLADRYSFELYGPGGFHACFLQARGRAQVVNLMSRAGLCSPLVSISGDVQHADGISWQHFYCPDGTILELAALRADQLPGLNETRPNTRARADLNLIISLAERRASDSPARSWLCVAYKPP
jgi:hypothetical protein